MATLKSVKSVSPAKRKRQGPGETATEVHGKSKFGGFKKPKVGEGFKAKSDGFKPKSPSAAFVKGKNSKEAPTGQGKFIKSKNGKSPSKFEKAGKSPSKFDKNGKVSSKFGGDKGHSAMSDEGETFKKPAPETPLDRKARKELAEYRKSQRRPNYNLEKEVKNLWEKMRQRDLEKTERAKLVTEALTKMSGKLMEMATSHVTSRVLQSCLKHCTKPERDNVFEELRPHILSLTKETYAYHIVMKMLDNASKPQLQQMISTLHGNVVSLLRHPVGSAVVEHAYHLANGHQRRELVSEFYSLEFRLFKGVAVTELDGGLKDLMAKEPASKQNTMVEHMMMSIQPILEKGIVDHSITHRALVEYLTVCKRSMVEDVVKSLTGPLLLRMIHTRDGAKIAVTCINMSTAKERKLIIKSMKGHVKKIAQDEHGSPVLMAILDLVDDTTLVSKVIISELLKDLKETISHKYGRRFVLHLLAPGESRYFPVDILTLLQHPAGVCSPSQLDEVVVVEKDAAPSEEVEPTPSTKKRKDMKAKKVDKDVETEAVEGEEAEDMEVDEGPKEVRGVSKKDPAVRRQEILSAGGLGKKLVETCAEMAEELLVSPVGADVIYEVAMGGVDGVLWKIASEQLLALHKAIAELVSSTEVSSTTSEDNKNVMTEYFSSRTIRRLIVNSLGSPFDKKAPSFAGTFYAGALKGKCKLWAKDHSEKVISAYTICKDSRAKKTAHAEIKQLVDAGVLKQQEKA